MRLYANYRIEANRHLVVIHKGPQVEIVEEGRRQETMFFCLPAQ